MQRTVPILMVVTTVVVMNKYQVMPASSSEKGTRVDTRLKPGLVTLYDFAMIRDWVLDEQTCHHVELSQVSTRISGLRSGNKSNNNIHCSKHKMPCLVILLLYATKMSYKTLPFTTIISFSDNVDLSCHTLVLRVSAIVGCVATFLRLGTSKVRSHIKIAEGVFS
jgi:hypothetical protein